MLRQLTGAWPGRFLAASRVPQSCFDWRSASDSDCFATEGLFGPFARERGLSLLELPVTVRRLFAKQHPANLMTSTGDRGSRCRKIFL